jgi:hypothetical protein
MTSEPQSGGTSTATHPRFNFGVSEYWVPQAAQGLADGKPFLLMVA